MQSTRLVRANRNVTLFTGITVDGWTPSVPPCFRGGEVRQLVPKEWNGQHTLRWSPSHELQMWRKRQSPKCHRHGSLFHKILLYIKREGHCFPVSCHWCGWAGGWQQWGGERWWAQVKIILVQIHPGSVRCTSCGSIPPKGKVIL